MTKQEEIREGIAIVVGCFAFNKPWCSLTEEQQNISNECAGEIVSRLYSQGVVRKVAIEPSEIKREECPDEPKYYGDMPYEMYDDGWRLVEPLIKESKNAQ